MDYVLTIVALLKIALFGAGFSLIFDYARTKERQLLYVVMLLMLFFTRFIISTVNLEGFYLSKLYYIVFAVAMAAAAVLIALWTTRKKFAIFFTVSTVMLLGTVTFLNKDAFTDKILTSAFNANSSEIGGIALLLSFIILAGISAIVLLSSASENGRDDLTFLVMEKEYLIIFFASYSLSILPMTILSEFISLFALAFLTAFSIRYRIILFRSFSEKIAMRDRDRNEILDLMYKISNAIAEHSSQEEIYKLISNSAKNSTSAECSALFLLNEQDKILENHMFEGLYPPVLPVNDYVKDREDRIKGKLRADKIPLDHNSYIGRVVQSGDAIFISDASNHPLVPQTLEGVFQIRSLIAVPLKIQDELIGVISVINKKDLGHFNESDLDIMLTLSDQAAISINTVNLYETIIEKEKGERDIVIAGEIQQNMLPDKPPNIEGVQLHSFSYAAKGVGGDYYDYTKLSDTKLGVILVDVAGKGVPASLVMVMIRSVWRIAAPTNPSPGDTIAIVNKSIAGDLTEERYATMFYLMYDEKTGEMTYTNAAHGPLLLYRAERDEFEELDADGLPVGIRANATYETKTTKLGKGDIAVLYTDGVTEAMDIQRNQFTLERVKDCIRRFRERDADAISNLIYKEITEFTGTAPQHDDQSLVIMKVV